MTDFDKRLETALDYMRAAIDMIAILENYNVLIDATGLFRLQSKSGQWIVIDIMTGWRYECNRIEAVAHCKRILQREENSENE